MPSMSRAFRKRERLASFALLSFSHFQKSRRQKLFHSLELFAAQSFVFDYPGKELFSRPVKNSLANLSDCARARALGIDCWEVSVRSAFALVTNTALFLQRLQCR